MGVFRGQIGGLRGAAGEGLPAVARRLALGGAAPGDSDTAATQKAIASQLAAAGLLDPTYAPAAMRSGAYGYAGAPTFRPRARAGLLRDDMFYVQDIFYAGMDPGTYSDHTDAAQQHLLDCYIIAKNLRGSGLDNLGLRNKVRAVFPRGTYTLTSPLVVPPLVEMDMRGLLFRLFPSAGSAPTSYNGDTTALALSNIYQPMLIMTPTSMADNLLLYGNPDGVAEHMGSGLVVGKTWGVSSVAIAAAGGGYIVGDTLTGANPDVSPYFGFQLTVTSVNGSGGITGVTLASAGCYAFPIELQKRVWTAANGFANIFSGNAHKLSGGAGAGAAVTTSWISDFPDGAGGGYRSANTVIGDTTINRFRSLGMGGGYSGSGYGDQFNILLTGLNHTIGEIQSVGGRVSLLTYLANDIRIGILNCVQSGFGVQSYLTTAMQCTNVVLDSVHGVSVQLNRCEGIVLTGQLYFAGAYGSAAATGGAQIVVGDQSGMSNDIYLSFDMTSAGGNPASAVPAAKLNNVRGSTFDLRVHNSSTANAAETGAFYLAKFAEIGSGFEASNALKGTINAVTGPLFSGAGIASGDTGPQCDVDVWDSAVQARVRRRGRYEYLPVAGAPTSGTSGTGVGKAARGSTVLDESSGDVYFNVGTAASPSWKLNTRAA